MTIFFWRRRHVREFAEGIQPELRAVPVPEPSAQLLDRILASREGGTRIILPEPFAIRRRTATRAIVALSIAAVLLLVVIPLSRRSATDDVASTATFFGSAAFAQTPRAISLSRVPPIVLSRPAAVRPLTMEFTRRVRSAQGVLTSNAKSSLSLTADTVDGTPAWRVISIEREAATAQPHTTAETLYVARGDLRLLRRAVHVSPYRRWQRINIQQQFKGDSVTGRMTTDGPSIGAGRPIAQRLRPEFGPYLSNVFAPVFLTAASLSPAWSGSASLLGWAVVDRDVFAPVELRVEGEERITVPAGTFDCWRISIRAGDRQYAFWARKSDGLGVRVLDDSDSAGRGRREVLLTRISR